MACSEPPVWEVLYDPNFIMDYQDTHYVIEMMLKPVLDRLAALEERIKDDGSVAYDYNDLANLPSINGRQVKGSLSLEDIGIDKATNSDIDNMDK